MQVREVVHASSLADQELLYQSVHDLLLDQSRAMDLALPVLEVHHTYPILLKALAIMTIGKGLSKDAVGFVSHQLLLLMIDVVLRSSLCSCRSCWWLWSLCTHQQGCGCCHRARRTWQLRYCPAYKVLPQLLVRPKHQVGAAETDLCACSCHHKTSGVSAEHQEAGERVYTLWNIIALNDSDVRGRRRSSSRGMHGAALSGVLSGTGHRH